MGGAVPIPNWPVGVNITDFGAIPNDGIDDSQALINAIAACPDYHAVWIPKGRFTILQKITPARNHFVLRGEDMYESVLFFPKYVGEAYIEQVGWTAGRTSLDRNHIEDAFLQMNGGTEKSIENLSFEFREQRKASPWDYPGANAISYGGGISNSWVRNVYIKNYDMGIGVTGNNLSFINIIADQFNGRQATDGDMSGKLDAYGTFMPRNSAYNLYHNIEITGCVLQPIDLNGAPNYSVFSKIRTSDMNNRTVAYHGGGSHFNLYTDLNRPVVGPLIDGIFEPGSSTNRSDETYWGAENSRLSDDTWSTSTNRAIFVGYGNDWATRIDDTFWYEPAVPELVIPKNLYLAQLTRLGEPLPEDLPAPVPAPYEVAGDVFRMLPTDDITPGSSPTGMLTSAESYLKFDLTGASETAVAHARLRLTFKSIHNTPFRISAWTVTDDSWSEATLTPSNKPAVVSELDTKWILDTNADLVVEFDVTAFVRNELVGGDGVISLCVKKQEGNGFLSNFWSAEQGVHPELVIERTASSVPGAPSAPKGIRSTPLVGNIILDWDDNTESDVAAYKVYRTPYDYGNLPVAAGLVTSDYVDTSSESDWHVGMMDYRQVYHYWITAVDDHGYESPRSAAFVGATLHPTNSPPSFNQTVNLPNGTAGINYVGSLTSTASDPESDPLYFMKVSGPDWLKVGLDGALSGTPGAGDAGMHSFTFQVTAIGGNTLKSANISVNPPSQNPPPAAPQNLAATAGDGVVTLDWADNSEPDLQGYTVYRALAPSGAYSAIQTGLTTSNCTDASAVNGTAYNYVVTAVDTAGNESLQSQIATATPSSGTRLLGGNISVSSNWTNGLPSNAQSPGTISVNGTVDVTFNGTFYMVQTAGQISGTGIGSNYVLNGGIFTQSGGIFGSSTFRGFNTNNSSVVTINSGSIVGGSVSGSAISGGSSLTVNGGTFQQYGTRSVLLTGNSTITINAGNFTAPADLGLGRLGGGSSNAININGGTTQAGKLRFGDGGAQLTFNIGGTANGTFTATDYALAGDDSEVVTARLVNWLPGSKITMTLTAAASNWAQTEWEAGRLTYNGQGNATYGSWAAVTATGGLGGGYSFAYDSATRALTLTTAPLDVPPTLVGITDDAGGGPISTYTSVNYTVTFSEDMDAATVQTEDFGNAGTAASVISSVSETSPGVFLVSVTPTSVGSLQLRINAGALPNDLAGNPLNTTSAILDDTTITVRSKYEAWSGASDFDVDSNGDGVRNGLAFLLGAAHKNVSALSLLPTATHSGGNLILTFNMLNSANRKSASLRVQQSNDLGISDAWAESAVVPDVGGLSPAVNGVTFNVTLGSPTNTVVATVAASEALPGTKLFGRLKANNP